MGRQYMIAMKDADLAVTHRLSVASRRSRMCCQNCCVYATRAEPRLRLVLPSAVLQFAFPTILRYCCLDSVAIVVVRVVGAVAVVVEIG